MTTDPRGRWFRVYARQVRQHRKFRDLTCLELGAWTVLRSEAELRDRAIIADRAEALLVLRRRKVPRPAVVLDRLVGLTLFDVLDDGAIAVHDREDHDRPKFPSDDPEKVKDRVQRHRESKRNEDSNESVTTGNDNETIAHARAPESGAGDGAVSDSHSEAGAGEPDDIDWDAPDSIVAYHQLTGKYPRQTVIDWLNRLSDDHPEEAISRFLAEQYTDDPNLGTLLSRTEAALKLDAHRRDKADKKARAKAQANAEAPHREKEREATPEEREQAALQRQAISIGLKMGVPVPTDAAEVRKFVMKHGSAA